MIVALSISGRGGHCAAGKQVKQVHNSVSENRILPQIANCDKNDSDFVQYVSV